MAYKAFFDEYRTFGVEIEYIGVTKPEVARRLREAKIRATVASYSKNVSPVWRVSTDSSIAGKPAGEVVSPILSGRSGLGEVERVMDKMAQIGCRVNQTCGLHVHWNAIDFTGKNVMSLLRFYAKFERVIDYLVSPSRRADINLHCRSMVKDNNLAWVTELDATEKARATDVEMNFRTKHSEKWYDSTSQRYVERSSRYHKVNISAYQQFRTIEFRQHQGTVNSTKGINWIVFTQQLMNKAKHVSVSRQVSAKPTLGEMLRVLKIVDHEFILNQCTDPLILNLGVWLKKRYTLFREGLVDE